MSRRITFAMVAMIVGTLLLTGLGTVATSRIAGRATELSDLRARANQIADLVPALAARPNESGTPTADPKAAEIRNKLIEVLGLSGVTQLTIGASGRVVGDPPTWIPARQLDFDALRRGETLSGSRGNRLWAASVRTNTNGSATVAIVTRTREKLLAPAIQWLLWSSVIALGIGIGVAVLLGRRLSRPVRDAVAATERIASGDLTARLAQPSRTATDELSTLTHSINTMASELERSKALEHQFLMSVSHDLRTPLTSIRGYAEAIADSMTDSPTHAAEVILAESARLERLVADLLDLAKLDARQFSLHLAPTHLAGVIAAAHRAITPESAAANLSLHVAADFDPIVTVDPDRLAQAIGNLSSNSLQFARTAVWIRTRPEQDSTGVHGVAIEIADDGPGIDAEDLPRVFERMYQARNQVERKESGSGLGLAIVRELVDAMGGRVNVVSTVGTGSTFSIWLPTTD